MSKTFLMTALVTAAVLSADACGDLQNIQKCKNTLQSDIMKGLVKGTSPCDVLKSYLTCIDDELASCPRSMRDRMEKRLKRSISMEFKDLDKCQAELSPTPSASLSQGPSPLPSLVETSASCDSFDFQSKMSECRRPLMQAAASSNVCEGWKQMECCLLDSVASCGKSIQDQVKSRLASISDTLKRQPMFQNALAGCRAATCHSSPAVTEEVEKATSFMADIILEDPHTFDLDKFTAAVKKRTGLLEVEGVLKAFEILVQYVVPEAVDLKNVKAAIAKANSVQESQIFLGQYKPETNSGSRRLLSPRLLASKTTIIDARITVPDAEQAAIVKESAADVNTLLESDLGEAVSLSQAPVAIAQVVLAFNSLEAAIELTSDPSVATSMLASMIEKAGADVGGTIMVSEMLPQGSVSHTSSASSRFGAILAPVMFLMTLVFVM